MTMRRPSKPKTCSMVCAPNMRDGDQLVIGLPRKSSAKADHGGGKRRAGMNAGLERLAPRVVILDQGAQVMSDQRDHQKQRAAKMARNQHTCRLTRSLFTTNL